MSETTVKARVRAIQADQAIVEVEGGGCGRCHETGGCGGQHLTQMFCSGPKTFALINTVDARVGDVVRVAVGQGVVRRTANRVYGLPLISVVFGALLGNGLAGDLGAMAGAFLGLLLSLGLLRFLSTRRTGNSNQQPHIVSRV